MRFFVVSGQISCSYFSLKYMFILLTNIVKHYIIFYMGMWHSPYNIIANKYCLSITCITFVVMKNYVASTNTLRKERRNHGKTI